eukprot:jgi/Mesen1/6601/ME000338S05779
MEKLVAVRRILWQISRNSVHGSRHQHCTPAAALQNWKPFLGRQFSLIKTTSYRADSQLLTPPGYHAFSVRRFSDTAESKEEGGASWFGKLKGFFGSKKAEQEEFTLDQFADQLKKARSYGSLMQFRRGLPRGGENVLARSLEHQEAVIRAMTPAERADPSLFGSEGRARVAAQCSCSAADVDDVLNKFEWFRQAEVKVQALKREGKPVPTSFEELEQLMGGRWSPAASRSLAGAPGGTSRNAACPCGSGKKYKRCCGENKVLS